MEHIHFVTGRLAEAALRSTVASLSEHCGFRYTISVLPISVAALMSPKWIIRHLEVPTEANRVVLPGYLGSGVQEIRDQVNIPVECGPKDLRDLPEYFGKPSLRGQDYGDYSIEILAEINYANRLSLDELARQAVALNADGADVIDLGCDPSSPWPQIGEGVKVLRELGLRVSVDSFDCKEVADAAKCGAELVLSVNCSNREAAADWGVEVVVVPDDLDRFTETLAETLGFLEEKQVPYRIDPILEPIGCGFAESLARYRRVRQDYPDKKILMGIGNVTELTDVDSAGVNTLLLGYCQELGIQSVLTTQVISWGRSSVRECDIARRLVHYSIEKKIPPKRLEERLVMLRDPRVRIYSKEHIASLVQSVRDNNYRILTLGEEIHLIASNVHVVGTDPFEMMEELLGKPESENVDASHAFYLGFEFAKAQIAVQLGKNYEQDQALQWGHLTRDEPVHRLAKRQRKRPGASE